MSQHLFRLNLSMIVSLHESDCNQSVTSLTLVSLCLSVYLWNLDLKNLIIFAETYEMKKLVKHSKFLIVFLVLEKPIRH